MREIPGPRKSAAKILFVLAILIPSIALAVETATIKMKTGEVFEDVVPDVFDIYRTVLFEYGGQRISVNFTDIEWISDESGKDITAQVLETGSDEERQELLSGKTEKADRLDNRPWKAMIAIGGNYGVPSGRYFEGLRAGFGFNGNLRAALNDKIAIELIVSRSKMNIGDDVQLVVTAPFYTLISESIEAHTTRYELAINFFRPIWGHDEGRGMLHTLFGLGQAINNISVKGTVRDYRNGQIVEIKENHSDSRLAIVLGCGAMTMVSAHLGMELSGTMEMIPFITGKYSSNGKGIIFSQIFDLKASVVAKF